MADAMRALICGVSGLELSAAEDRFLRDVNPWGLILFRRNCADPQQVAALVAAFRTAVGRADAPVLIDQEGGRVQRLAPPHWPKYPPARVFEALFSGDPLLGCAAARLGARLMADDLHRLGINVDCLPVLDVPVAGAHDIIGDRAYSADPDVIIALSRAVCEGMVAGGVLPVIKHIPGHGRALADSHEALPEVDASLDDLMRSDFRPFRALTDMPLAMTAHVVYRAVDAAAPATTSRKVMRSVVRGHIGYDGLVMCDDLSMKALRGSLAARTRAVFAAGCDMALHCNGQMDEMREVAAACPPLRGRAQARAKAALARIAHAVEPLDRPAMEKRFFALIDGAQVAGSTAFASGHALSV